MWLYASVQSVKSFSFSIEALENHFMVLAIIAELYVVIPHMSVEYITSKAPAKNKQSPDNANKPASNLDNNIIRQLHLISLLRTFCLCKARSIHMAVKFYPNRAR